MGPEDDAGADRQWGRRILMPYIATDLDAFDAAQGVSGATGLPLQHVLGGLALLWRWCWRGKVDRASGEQVCALLGSTHAGLLPALLAFGFVEGLGEHGYRVRGVERYLHISAARSAAGKVRAANAKRSRNGRLQPAPSQHVLDGSPAPDQHPASSGPALTATSDERRATSEQTDLPRAPPAGPRVKKDTAGKKHDGAPDGSDNAYTAFVAAMFTIFRENRGRDPQPDGKNWKALQRLRGKHPDSEIIRRWGNGVPAQYERRTSSFVALEAKWDACGDPEPAGKVVKAAGATGGGEVVEFPEWPEVRDG